MRQRLSHMGRPLAELHVHDSTRVVEIPGKGRGVVAARKIGKGELIESAYVVVLRASEVRGELENYVYDWPYLSEWVAIALGKGSLYNHSFAPNADYTKKLDERVLEYHAIKDIEAGEEILINYNGTPTDMTPLWFTVV